MAVFNKFYSFTEAVTEKKHDLGVDALKIMLTNVAPVATNAFKADLTEIAAGNGYTAGGTTVVITSSAQNLGVYKLVGNDVIFTAAGGVIGPFRYPVLYNSSAAGQELIGWWDYGSSVTLSAGETFTTDLDQANGILTLT